MKNASLVLIAAATLAACAKDDLSAKSNEGPKTVSAVNVASTATGPTIKVYKDPNCGCCNNWVEHLRENGFVVETMDMPDLSLLKQRYMIGEQLQSCHTAVVGDYAIEGHVPADLIHKLLKEKPAVAGLAVPGMPQGSPGMEGAIKERYDVLTFDRAGKTTVYAQR